MWHLRLHQRYGKMTHYAKRSSTSVFSTIYISTMDYDSNYKREWSSVTTWRNLKSSMANKISWTRRASIMWFRLWETPLDRVNSQRQSRLVASRSWGKENEEFSLLADTEFLAWEVDRQGWWWPTLWVSLMALDYILDMLKMANSVLFTFYHFEK